MKKYILSSIILLLAAANTAWGQVAKIGSTEYATLAEALDAAREAAAGGWNTTSVTVEILENITFSSTDTWTPIVYNQLNPITINGNNHTITNLPGMLYAKSGSGVSSLTINDLTFESPTVTEAGFAAVIMGYGDCVQGLYFNNVTINEASVTATPDNDGFNYAAAFVAYAAGYSNTNDGPLFQNVVFNNCKVTSSTINATSGGSVGALMGHASASTDSRIEVEATTVSGNTISTAGSKKAGALFGTVGAACATTNHPEAGLYVSANVSNNTVTANNTAITTIYGRQGSSTGELTLTEGGSYDNAPIAATDAAWATVAEGNELQENNGTYTVAIDGVAKIGDTEYATLEAAITAATAGQTITLLTNVELDEPVDIDKSITLDLGGKTISISAANQEGYAISVSSGTVTITGDGTIDAGDEIALLVLDGAVTIENGTFNTVGVDDGSLTITDGTFGYLMTTGGTTTVNGGEFNGTVQVEGGSLEINYGTFTANDENVLQAMSGGTITVNGGSFTATKSGDDWPIVALAGQDGLIQISGGTFTGGENSVLGVDYNTNGKFEVSGGQFSEQVPAEYCAAGYVPTTTADANGMYTVQVDAASAVASITNANNETTNYLTLQDAIDAATDGQTIQLLANIDLGTTGIVIDSGKNFTLDLNGYDITGTVNGKLITNNGTLTISGNGHVYNQDISAQGHDAVYNTGTLVINAGTFGDADDDMTNANTLNRGAAVRNYGGTATINGGKFTACDNYTNGGFAYALINDNNGTMTINDAVVYGKNNGNIANNYGQVTVKDGTFTLNNASSYYSLYVDGEDGPAKTIVEGGTFNNTTNNGLLHTDDANNASLEISGGEFTYTNLTNKNSSVVSVSGGTFSSVVPTGFCAPDYVPTTEPDGNGKYTVVPPTYVAQIGTTKYTSLAAAVAAAQAGDVITMIADDDVSLTDGSEIEINKPITITGAVDADGKPLYTIYGKNDAVLNNSTWNDIFVASTGTVTISNLKFAQFSNLTNTAMSRSPILVSSNNNNVVLSNLHFSELNCSAIHINGGSFEISDCYIDCEKTTGTVYTKGIEIVNAAHGTISNTTIENATGSATTFVAAIEASGSGDVEITGCTINSSSDYAYGIAISTNENTTAGSSAVTVSNCTINAAYTLYNDSDQDGVISVSSGTYNGKLLSDPNANGIVISGGTYDARVPMEYLADTYICPSTTNNDGRFYVTTGSYVAKITFNEGTEDEVCYGYETLAAAVAAAGADDEIILLDNITLDADITCNLEDGEALVITFGAFDITKGDYSVLLPTGVSVITDKSTDIFSALVDGKAILEEVETVGGDVVYTYSVADAVAVIGETPYATLAAAIAAVPADGTKTTITMIDNETVAEGVSLTVPATKNIVLDLNGKTVTGSSTTVSPNFYFITNKGTLEITDSSTGASGKITYGCTNPNPGYTNEYVTICNEGGSFTLTKGTIENTSGGLSYAVNNRSVAQGTATFNLNGGTVSAPSGDAAVRVYQSVYNANSPYDNIVNVTGGTILDKGIFVDSYIGNNVDGSNSHLTVNISGGTVNGLIDYKLRHPYNTSLNITDGTFGNSKLWVRKYASEWKGSAEPTAPIVTISGGQFQFKDNMAFGLAYECGETSWTSYTKPYEVSGGVFNVNLNDYSGIKFAEGMFGVENTDPATSGAYPYTVGVIPIAQIGETIYPSLAAAIAAVPTDGTKTTIKMLDNETFTDGTTLTVAAGKNIVLDLNGKTVAGIGGTSSASFYFITNKGTLEITDNTEAANGKITYKANNYDTGYSKEYVTIYNLGGTLTLTKGTVENMTGGGLAYAINNSSNAWGTGDDKETIFNMTGGTINAPTGDAGLRVYQNCAASSTPYSHNTVNISGGTIASGGIFLDNYIYQPTTSTTGDGILTNVTISGGEIHGLIDLKLRHAFNTNLNITGGTFVDSKLWVRKHGEWSSNVAEPTEPIVAISGGKFQFANGKAFGLAYDCGETSWTSYTKPYEVSGGIYNVDLNNYSGIKFPPYYGGVANMDPSTKTDYPYTVGLTSVAKIGTTGYATLEAAVTAAQAGQTIELLTDIDLGTSSPYVVIDKAVIIDGGTNQYEIKGTGSDHGTDTEATIVLQGSGNVTLKNLKVTNPSTNNNGVGIKGTTYSGKLTIDNCVITVPMRGVNVENIASGFSMDITNSTIQSNIDAPTTTYVDNVDSRGISFSDADELATAVTITDTKIQGFKYDIYVGENKKNLTLTMNGVEAYGLNMLNLNGANNTVNLNATSQNGATTFSAFTNGSLVTDEDAYGASSNIIYLDETTKTATTNNVLNAVTALTTVSAGTGKYKLVSASAAVAQIGDTKYETLEAAFAAVQNGETITMLKDYTLTAPMNLELGTKAVSLDLGGNTLTGRTNLKNGKLTIQNGTVAGGNQQALNVYGSATPGTTDYSVLTIASNVTVTADQFGVCMFGATATTNGYGAVVNIAGTVHTTGNGAEGAVFVSGNLGNNITGDQNNVINVTGTITSDTDAAIALNGNATVNVQDGAVITGNTAIAIKRGTLNVVEGATVHATGLGNIPTAGNNNGTEMTGAAVSMTNTYNNYGAMQVNISGGSFTSDHAMALYKQEGTYTNDATYAVSGGIFNTPVPEEFCAEGYVPTSITTQGFTQYTVESGDFVAQIGDTKYTTLAAAVAAVPTNGTETTITLLKDITLTNNVVVGGTYGTTPKTTTAITNQKVKLDLNGHNITGEKTLYLAGGSLNITGTGSITSTSVDVAPVGVRYVKNAANPDGLDYTSKRTLTIGSDVTLTGAQYGLNIFGTNEPTTANNIDVTVDGKVNGMLFVLGNLSNANNNIVINVSGTVDASQATGSEKVKTGIALCGNASVHIIDGAVVKGESGIEVRAGELIMDGDVGGTITATSADYSYTTNGSGTTVKGAAIAVAQHGTKIATSATILGGTLTGAKKIAVIDAQTNSLSGVTVIADDDFLTNSATETVLPDGYYWLSNGDGTSSPAPNSYVAQIGNTFYTTLAAAVAAVPADGTPTTITLLQDINLTERLFVNAGATPAYAGTNNRYATTTENKNITLELDGHNIVSSSNIALAGGSLNITNNGTADATHGVISTTAGGLAPIEVRGTGDLTKKRTLTIGTGVTLSGAEYGLNIFGSNDQQKNIIDVNVNGTVNGMLFVLGNLKNADNEININVNGTVDASGVTGTGEAVHSGIALGGNANVTVANGATVKGESGIEVRAGSLTVNGGTITATSADYSYTANGSGMTTKGAAIAVAQHGTLVATSANILGGTLNGTKLIAVNDVNGNDLTDVSVVASNSFVANVADTAIPAGFLWVDNGNNTKKLVLAPVRRNDVGYATLAEAIAAVENNDIIKLFADITLTDDIVCPQGTYTFMLGFNNHNVIQNGYHVMLPTGVSVLTDEQTQLFTAADEGYVVVQNNSSNQDYPYEYSVKKSIASSGITVTVDPATYNGTAQTPVVTVTDGTTELVQGTDYTISYKGGTDNSHLVNADTYVEEIVITGKGNYGGMRYADFIILPLNLTDYIATANAPYVATGYGANNSESGAAVKSAATITIVNGSNEPLSNTLLAKLDITIDNDPTAANNYNNTGTYEGVVHATPKVDNSDPNNIIDYSSNFTGTIAPGNLIIGDGIDITNSLVVTTPNAIYTGAALPPSADNMIVKVGTTTLTYGTHYTFTYNGVEGDYVDAKTYRNAITITGLGTYTGTFKTDYVIAPRDLSDTGVTVTATELAYNTEEHDVVVTVKYGNNTIPAANYTFDPTKVTEAGLYDVTVTAVENSNLVGSRTVVLKVTKALDGTYASDFTVSPDPIPTQTETGNEIKPVIVVKDKDRVMTSGVDYTVAYTNNINAGTATITITGTGAYSGTKTINFTIVAAYFTENGITYHHANEGEEVSVGNSGKTLAVDINTTGNPVAVPQTVTHDNKTYTVTGVEQNAFSSTAITGIVLPKSIEEVENGAFNGANNLRYVDLSTATGFTPSSLQRNIAASPFNGVPKQALVFLNGTTFTGENYVYNPGSGNDYYCEVFKIYDDMSGAQTGFGGDDYKWSFENPHQFTAYSVENTRQLTAERHYTICLPYALEIPNNVKAYTLEATSNQLFGFTEVTGTLAAYTPYVLIPTKSGQLLGTNNNTVVPEFQPATDADATKLHGQATSSFTMYGNMRYMDGTDAVGKYIMQYNNGNPTWKKITETNAGFNESNKACILPMRAYIMSNTGGSGSREFFDVVFTNIDGTTLTFDKVTFDDDTIYDLSGRKVELLERGHTYIINGKKVMVK